MLTWVCQHLCVQFKTLKTSFQHAVTWCNMVVQAGGGCASCQKEMLCVKYSEWSPVFIIKCFCNFICASWSTLKCLGMLIKDTWSFFHLSNCFWNGKLRGYLKNMVVFPKQLRQYFMEPAELKPQINLKVQFRTILSRQKEFNSKNKQVVYIVFLHIWLDR